MDDRFLIELSAEAEKGLKTIQKNNIIAILKKLNSIRINPYRFVERLVGVELYKLRIGDYRVILHIDSKKRIISVVKIGHRKDIYDRR